MKIHNVDIEIIKGDIAEQPDMDAIVNAANAELQTGGGVAGAIHRAAGPTLAEECSPLAPIKPGKAVITRAHNLPNDHVIHCLGPIFGIDQPEDQLLANCYKNSLQLAEENKISSLAFPAISTGAFHYPINEATDIVIKVLQDKLADTTSIEKIRFVLFTDSDFNIYEEKFKKFI